MWFLKHIPKIVHFYWGGKKLPYLRYLTIKTFGQLNPEWTIKYYYPTHPTENESWESGEQKYNDNWDDYVNAIMSAHRIIKVPVDFSDMGIDNDLSEVHKSDFLRWTLLSSSGGLWSDMDILYYKPLKDITINNKRNEDKKSVVCISDYGHSIGFLMSRSNNNDFRKLGQMATSHYLRHSYQCMGSLLFNKVFPDVASMDNATNIPMHTVYPLNANQVKQVFGWGNMHRQNGNIGIHWYAGSKEAGDFLNKTNGGKENLPDCLLSQLIKKND